MLLVIESDTDGHDLLLLELGTLTLAFRPPVAIGQPYRALCLGLGIHNLASKCCQLILVLEELYAE